MTSVHALLNPVWRAASTLDCQGAVTSSWSLSLSKALQSSRHSCCIALLTSNHAGARMLRAMRPLLATASQKALCLNCNRSVRADALSQHMHC